jgi:hypothetical protein
MCTQSMHLLRANQLHLVIQAPLNPGVIHGILSPWYLAPHLRGRSSARTSYMSTLV